MPLARPRPSFSRRTSIAARFALAAACGLAACGGESAPSNEPGAADASADVLAPSPSSSSTTAPADAAAAPVGTSFPPADGAGAWDTIDPPAAGFDERALGEVKDWIGQTNGTSFLVLAKGKILVEAYWGGDARTVRDVASAQKSVVSLLVGLAVAGHGLDPDATVSSLVGPGWTNDTPANEAAITVRHLLTMTSGLDDSLVRVAAPGATWRYNTNAYHCIAGVVEAKTGKTLGDFTRSALFDRIGAGPSAWTTRPFQKDGKGNPIRALEMTARDMARIGLLVQAGGTWSGASVLPAGYLAAALGTSQALNPSYGLLFWLNGKDSFLLPGAQAPGTGPLMPSAPVDVVAALGALDQKIHVSRSSELVVVRQGTAAAQGTQAVSDFDDQLWRRLLAARKPR